MLHELQGEYTGWSVRGYGVCVEQRISILYIPNTSMLNFHVILRKDIFENHISQILMSGKTPNSTYIYTTNVI